MHIARMVTDSMPDQLELFFDAPFSMRLKIEEAMHIFWEKYWQFLPTAKSTRKHKQRILTFFKGQFIDVISKADIEDFRRSMVNQGLQQATINQAHMLLSRMFTKLREYKDGKHAHGVDYSKLTIPSHNPCALVPRTRVKKRTQVATKAEFDRLRYFADDDMTDILNMLLYTRLRPGDLQRLTSNEIDLQRGKIVGIQNKTITTRNPSGVPFMIPINQQISDMVLPRLARTKPGEPLFPFKNMQKRWKELREKAGVLHIQMRDFRRTAATFLLDNGVDPQTVAEGLGHTSLKMLPTYTPRTIVHQQKSMELLEKAFK